MINESNLEEQTQELLTYDVKEIVINAFKEQAFSIVVSDWQDEENTKKARKLRTEIKALFEKVDRRRKDIKNFIDKKGKEVTSKIEEPIKYLDSQIAIRDNEIKRQKEEAQRIIDETIQSRWHRLQEFNYAVDSYMLHPDTCSEEKFLGLVALAQDFFKAKEEEKRKTEEEAKAIAAELEILRAQNKLLEKKLEIQETQINLAEPTPHINSNSPILTEQEEERIVELLEQYATRYDLALYVIKLEKEVSDIELELY
jgi:hypothetical protein